MATIDTRIQEAEQKLKIYQEELDKIIKALALKRTEMSTLAKQTLSNFEAQIPALEEKIALLNAEIKRLDRVIEEKRKASEREYTNYANEFHNKEQELEQAYEKKMVEATRLIAEAKDAKAEAAQQIASLNDREDKIRRYVEEKEKSFFYEKQQIESQITTLDKLKESHIRLVDETSQKIQKERDELNARAESIATLESELKAMADELKRKDAIADSIIANADQVSERIENCICLEEKIVAKNEESNRLRVEALAEMKRANKRMAELDAREQELLKREQNIKDAEAKIGS